MRIKICGITNTDDARCAEREGAHAIGVVMFSDSPRSVTPEQARAIFDSVGPFTTTVAVSHTRSKDELARILALHPSAVQISFPFMFDNDPGARIIRVIRRGDELPDDCDAVIVDESHGGGRQFDLRHVREVVQQSSVPVILAGGLTPQNVGDAIEKVHPYAVDVASGVEQAPGRKDTEKIRAFIAACMRT
jgi:phosphoribosylanthranilate isomerase